VTSSWFFLSTLNYDARSTTHQMYVLCSGWGEHCCELWSWDECGKCGGGPFFYNTGGVRRVLGKITVLQTENRTRHELKTKSL